MLGSVRAVPGATPAAVQLLSVVALQNGVNARLSSIDLSGAVTDTAKATAIRSFVLTDPGLSAQVNALAASGTINGRVTDATGAGLPNIDLVAFDFLTLDVQARTLTDANGNYTLRVPTSANPGYIVSARNFGTSSSAASEYYKAGGHGRWIYEGDRVTVAVGAPTLINMKLLNGARLSGRVLAGSSSGAPLSGVRVATRAVDVANLAGVPVV